MSAALHDYLSTACFHGLHERCRKSCKFCDVACRCPCHSQEANAGRGPALEAAKGGKTEAELDAMHAAIVARFPAGLTPQQYRQVILESADENDGGRVYPHSVSVPGEPLFQCSFLMGMVFDGLLEHWNDGSGRSQREQPARYKITDKGRAWLKEIPPPARERG